MQLRYLTTLSRIISASGCRVRAGQKIALGESFFSSGNVSLAATCLPHVVNFLGLKWDPRCREVGKTDSVVMTPSVWQARPPICKTSVERWRSYEPSLPELAELLPNRSRTWKARWPDAATAADMMTGPSTAYTNHVQAA